MDNFIVFVELYFIKSETNILKDDIKKKSQLIPSYSSNKILLKQLILKLEIKEENFTGKYKIENTINIKESNKKFPTI